MSHNYTSNGGLVPSNADGHDHGSIAAGAPLASRDEGSDAGGGASGRPAPAITAIMKKKNMGAGGKPVRTAGNPLLAAILAKSRQEHQHSPSPPPPAVVVSSADDPPPASSEGENALNSFLLSHI
jgi:hypothetical protein